MVSIRVCACTDLLSPFARIRIFIFFYIFLIRQLKVKCIPKITCLASDRQTDTAQLGKDADLQKLRTLGHVCPCPGTSQIWQAHLNDFLHICF